MTASNLDDGWIDDVRNKISKGKKLLEEGGGSFISLMLAEATEEGTNEMSPPLPPNVRNHRSTAAPSPWEDAHKRKKQKIIPGKHYGGEKAGKHSYYGSDNIMR